MSRIGKKPITIDSAVTLTVEEGGSYGNQKVTVKGPKGELVQDIRPGVKVSVEDGVVRVGRDSDAKQNRAYHGLYRSLIDNMIVGVKDGYEKDLEIHGVGYRAKLVGRDLELSLGYTHPIKFDAPEEIEFIIEKEVDIKVKGIDKALVGKVAAQIRELRKPEPYKGKGIRYKGEYVRRKVGKAIAK